jgi:hypothetical protein
MMSYSQEIVERAVAYLERHKGEWVREDQLALRMNQAGIPEMSIYNVIKKIKKIANIGAMWSREQKCMTYTWYERRAGDELAEHAIETF